MNTTIFLLFMLLVALIQFLVWIRRTKWKILNQNFPETKNTFQMPNGALKYGRANLAGYYKWNSVFSGITENGVIIRKPFPFNLLMSAINIPFAEIDNIIIVDKIDDKSKLTWFKYANIKLKSVEICLRIPWDDSYQRYIEDKGLFVK